MPHRLPPASRDLAFALELADLADTISLPRFRAADLHVEAKPDQSFVTDADQSVERALRAHIEVHRPDDSFYGEESGRSEKGHRRWLVDPIDGTSNYLRGVPNWSTLIALEVDEELSIGVVSAPAFAGRWWAEKGTGAWAQSPGQRPRRLKVSSVKDLDHASLSFQSIEQWENEGRIPSLLALAKAVWQDRAIGDMWAYMLLAEGLIDIVAEFDLDPYDIAALVPIVTEAGGRLTDIDGLNSIRTGSVLATNGSLHPAALAVLHAQPL
ncbi:inositol monophosphatase family protein [Microbacterium azadirachtae]|uniref:Histidinol-phosphatase n=1 Tax=Microbacterium azadirachtae TaxID=582680 RepID=A0A1I6G6R2_9MICO|nr:inositol monophosphatase family protein [Microbacterium azadirachtae]SDL35981.1 histidinol-phosphate phosphatase [Microbacterium azadirachtae]SEF66711.1 histidinol-phosphate phosphatase [Microbacterium azadirachtae]SEF67482.1 histidinol-phosphate phosphatase [Microbacterium azadirachtae]SFR37886.1 histidinol-phosphate phosphatase [Microbacterium azadirachtae]